MALIDKVHRMYRKDRVTNDIFAAIEKYCGNTERDINDIEKQGLLNFATWYLDVIEGELGITDKEPTLEGRRGEVKVKLFQRSKVSMENVVLMCRNYTNYVKAYYDADKYTITIETEKSIAKRSLQKMQEQLREYVPAHILLKYTYFGRTHGQMNESGFTHEYLHSFTHEQIREKAEM